MKHRNYWLLALLSVLTLMTTTAVATAGDLMTSGHVEIGVSAMDTNDSPARVNEFVKTTDNEDSTVNPALNLGLHVIDQHIVAELETTFDGSDNYDISVKTDLNRIFKLEVNSQSFQHRLDHETLGQLGATMRGDLAKGQPTVSTDQTLADVYAEYGGATPVGNVELNYDPAQAVAQELSNEYIVTRRETKAKTELTVPSLPNITFHAGMRIEEREGLKQAIGVTKCDGCHVSAVGKNIDERTEEFNFGATGKFGKLTVEYEFMNRTFDEDGQAPTRFYDNASDGNNANLLLYEADDLAFNRTPDSEKDSHLLKARFDFSSNTALSTSYTQATVESKKSGVEDVTYSLASDTLKTEFESYGGKLATKIGDWRLSLRANRYTIDADTNQVTFPDTSTLYDPTDEANDNLSFSLTNAWAPAEEREVSELGIDAVYRLAQGTTLRLGYNYEKTDREEVELGETETNTFKVSLKSRVNKQLSGRISYEYQNIDDPFHGEDATGIAQGIGETLPQYPGLEWLTKSAQLNKDGNNATTVWYWNSVYPNRTLDATSEPDAVHEAKLSTTWAPSTNMAATVFARVRMEENDSVKYKQDTYVPGISLWYAPNSKINLTMAYTFNKQKTENQMCVGWYHG